LEIRCISLRTLERKRERKKEREKGRKKERKEERKREREKGREGGRKKEWGGEERKRANCILNFVVARESNHFDIEVFIGSDLSTLKLKVGILKQEVYNVKRKTQGSIKQILLSLSYRKESIVIGFLNVFMNLSRYLYI
jgi:hypothetical protein